MLPTFGKKALVIDVGSWTVDSMLIVNKKPDNSRCDTQNEGLIKCMRAINRVAVQVKNRKIDEAEIQEYMKTGKTELPKDFKEIMDQQIHEFVDKVYRYQTECGYSLDMIPVYFAGGGAVVMRNFGKYQQSKSVSKSVIGVYGWLTFLRIISRILKISLLISSTASLHFM